MLKEACSERGIEHAYTTRSYFGKYTYKATIPFPLKIQNLMVQYEQMCREFPRKTTDVQRVAAKLRTSKTKFVASLFEKFSFLEDENAYAFRKGKNSITFYSNDPQIIESIILSGETVSAVSSPKDETVALYLAEHPKTIVREKYFFDKYKYCVVLRLVYLTRSNLDRYLRDNLFLKEKPPMRIKNHVYRTHYTSSDSFEPETNEQFRYTGGNRLYFSDLVDVTLARITIPECIDSIEEIVLNKDIENAGSIAA